MGDRELWVFINTFAGWASAVASSAAVITALYLARRGDRIRLRVRCGIRIVITQGTPGPNPEFVNLEVTNLGRRPARISNLYWTARFGRKQMVWMPPVNPMSNTVPVTLADGETANWLAPIAEFDANFADVARLDARTRLLAFTIRAGVLTSTGARFSTRIEKRLRDHLRELGRTTPAA